MNLRTVLLLFAVFLLIPGVLALPGGRSTDLPVEEAPVNPDFRAFTEGSAARGGRGAVDAGAPGLPPRPSTGPT